MKKAIKHLVNMSPYRHKNFLFRQVPFVLILVLAIAAGLSVANVYYAQPLLDLMADEFHLSYGMTGLVIAMTQIGSIAALLFIVPLGDLISRKTLILVQAVLLILSLLLLGFSVNHFSLFISLFLVGCLGTAMTQGLIVYAAILTDPQQRGEMVAWVQAGVLLGLLLSRTISGSLSDVLGWRGVYIFSAGSIAFILCLLGYILPNTIQNSPVNRYLDILRSMYQLLLTNRPLQIRGILAFYIFACLNLFWNTLVFPLSDMPFHYSHTTIGLFGLIGACGAIAAIRAGVWADQGYTRPLTTLSLLLLMISWLCVLMLYKSLWVFILGIILLDIAIQTVHVVNQKVILSGDIAMHSRLVAVYMLFYAMGSACGAILGTYLYTWSGWNILCTAGLLLSFFALLFWFFISDNSYVVKK